MSKSGIGCLEHLLNHCQGWCRLGIQAAEAAHCQHEKIKLQCDFGLAIVDDADIPTHGETIGMTGALAALGADHIINLLAIVCHIQLLACETAIFLIKVGAFGKQPPLKAQNIAIVVFQTNFFHVFRHFNTQLQP